ncbi:hypothetical protein SAMN04515665_13036 [Blastococcus sp. DSM 46786]|uniref:hypothetical protein n=1 Tax=Blastococcus sp. DSM 46786 TaxID=1798227 RepID=UPI0008C00752|nr:hypothetical protein [Blastococcus sp. DSM 46786]SEM09828.1 hypothetical protein SAMN04515665_13036 [Blastococcus sp. DSM 46786]
MAARQVSREFEELLARRVQADLIQRETALRRDLLKLARTHPGRATSVVERAVRGAVRRSKLPLTTATVRSLAELIRQGDEASPPRRRSWF